MQITNVTKQWLQKNNLWKLDTHDSSSTTIYPHTNVKKPETDASNYCQDPEMRINIIVLAFNRPQSLQRLLSSLLQADYSSKSNLPVEIEIHVDYPVDIPFTFMEKSDDSDAYAQVVQIVKDWQWPHGQKSVFLRSINSGLANQWHESWYPLSQKCAKEFAFIVEDDIELAPYWYQWLIKAVHSLYQSDDRLYGISLQNQKMCLSKCKHALETYSQTSEGLFFKYQLVGTWGQLLFPEKWLEFLDWMDMKRTNNSYKPTFSDLKSNQWYRKHVKNGDHLMKSVWTLSFIAFVAEKGYYNYYAKFPMQYSLSVGHREAGVHHKQGLSPDSKKMDKEHWNDSYYNIPSSVEIFDYHFNRVETPGSLEFRSWAFEE